LIDSDLTTHLECIKVGYKTYGSEYGYEKLMFEGTVIIVPKKAVRHVLS